jgi:hypothetical protein
MQKGRIQIILITGLDFLTVSLLEAHNIAADCFQLSRRKNVTEGRHANEALYADCM